MSKEMNNAEDTALHLREGETILWQGAPASFPINEKAGIKNLIVCWGLGPVAVLSVMIAFLANGGKVLSIINLFLVFVLLISIISPLLTRRSILRQRYYVTDQRAIVTMDGFEQHFVDREDIDEVRIESDTVQDEALIIGSELFPEIKKQLRWRTCNTAEKFGTKETGACTALVFYGLKDAGEAIVALGK